jgi:ribosomal protein L7/L12
MVQRICNYPMYWALHGNAFNPDTCQLAEYQELAKCSEGKYWIEANGDEIGRLAQGRKSRRLAGTDTIFFVALKDIPKHKKITYLKRNRNIAYDGLWART